MFERILQDEICMKMIAWLITHQDSECSGSTLGMICDCDNDMEFVHRLVLLDEAGIIKINPIHEEERLSVSLNTERHIVKMLLNLQEEFDAVVSDSERGCAAFHSIEMEQAADLAQFVDLLNSNDIESMINQVKNYEELDDFGVEGMIKEEIQDLKNEGRYEEFLQFLEVLK